MYQIIKKEILNPTVVKMDIAAPAVAKKALPGQFIILRVDERGERIPLTVAGYDRAAGTVTIIFQVVGATTECLRHKEEGEYIQDFVGPVSYTHLELYVTMQDLAGDRIDETIDLFDSCDILRPYDSSATCALVDYEEATRTATFLVTITEWGNHKIEGSKITFTVREFLSHKQFYEGVEIDVDLADQMCIRDRI